MYTSDKYNFENVVPNKRRNLSTNLKFKDQNDLIELDKKKYLKFFKIYKQYNFNNNHVLFFDYITPITTCFFFIHLIYIILRRVFYKKIEVRFLTETVS